MSTLAARLTEWLTEKVPFLPVDRDRGIIRNTLGTYPEYEKDGIRRFTLLNRAPVKRMASDFDRARKRDATAHARKVHEVERVADRDRQAAAAREHQTLRQLRALLGAEGKNLSVREAIRELDRRLHELRSRGDAAEHERNELRRALQETRHEWAKARATEAAERRRVALAWAREQYEPVASTDAGSAVGNMIVHLAAKYERYLESGTDGQRS